MKTSLRSPATIWPASVTSVSEPFFSAATKACGGLQRDELAHPSTDHVHRDLDRAAGGLEVEAAPIGGAGRLAAHARGEPGVPVPAIAAVGV